MKHAPEISEYEPQSTQSSQRKKYSNSVISMTSVANFCGLSGKWASGDFAFGCGSATPCYNTEQIDRQ